MRLVTLLLFLAVPMLTTGCSTAYYGLMSKLGQEKRDILVKRVMGAKEDQVDAQEQVKTTFEAFKELTNFDGGDLEDAYERFNSEYEDSVKAAEAVSTRIESIEDVAGAMFSEWEKELDQFSDDEQGRKARQRSEKLLQDSKNDYDKLLVSMQSARDSMDPVLSSFRNQVLTLKHSLNAAALTALQDEAADIEADVDTLIANMERSIAEAEAFIAQLDNAG